MSMIYRKLSVNIRVMSSQECVTLKARITTIRLVIRQRLLILLPPNLKVTRITPGAGNLTFLRGVLIRMLKMSDLWYGVSQVVWHHAGVCRLSIASEQFGAEPAATLARMVLWRRRQKREAASRTGREHVFWAVGAVDPGVVACG